MLAVKSMDVRDNFKSLCDKVYKTISFTMEELEAMEADDWVPTTKVLEFMEKMNEFTSMRMMSYRISRLSLVKDTTKTNN